MVFIQDTEPKRGFLAARKATIFLILACFIAYPFGLHYSALSCSYDSIFLSGNWWTVFTAIFMHANNFHLLGNMLFLFFFGSGLEKLVGSARLFFIFIAGGAISMFLSVLYYAHNQPSLGASGAISTILATLMLINPWRISVLLTFVPVPVGVAGFTFCLINLKGLFIDYLHPPEGGMQVAYLAHIIGFIVGIFFGVFLTASWKKNLLMCIIQFVCYYFLLRLVFRFV